MHTGSNHWFAHVLTILSCINMWYVTLLCKQKPSNIILLSPTTTELNGLFYGIIICVLSWLKKINILSQGA